MNTLMTIIKSNSYAHDPVCHSFISQTLAKLKSNVQINEMVKFSNVVPFLQAISEFAVITIHSSGYFGDLAYTLILWARYLDALRFSSHPIFNYIPESTFQECVLNVNKAYITTFINQIDDYMDDDDDRNPVQNVDLVLKHCDQLGIMLTYQYDQMSEMMSTLATEQMVEIKKLLQQIDNDDNDNILNSEVGCQLKKRSGKWSMMMINDDCQ